jgi:hypothetical protein
VLSSDEAREIFSQFNEESRVKRKVEGNKARLWPTTPINYLFDGSHCMVKIIINSLDDVHFYNYLSQC